MVETHEEREPVREPEGGRVYPGRPPRLQRIGRGAAVAGVVGFLAVLAFLTTRYSHGVPRPEGAEAERIGRGAAVTEPLTAARIEEYARERLKEELRARQRAPGPPELGLPAEVPVEVPERVPLPPPPPLRATATAAPRPVRELPALRSPLSPGGGRASVPSAGGAAPAGVPERLEALRGRLEEAMAGAPVGAGASFPGWGGAAPERGALEGPAPLAARRVELPSLSVHRLERVAPASGARLLAAGTVVPLVLTHDLSTDVPGPVRAWVARDVLDSGTHSRVLIPRGTVVVGDQAARTAAGDRRVLIAWRRLRLPSGVGYVLPELPAGALDGTAGARGEIDRHWWSRFGSAVALSLVGAGVQLAQPQERTAVSGFTPSEGQVVAQQLGLELGRLSREVLRRGLDRPPTIHLSAGHRMSLLLTRDLAF